MFRKFMNSIEGKRNTNNIFWKILIWIKDTQYQNIYRIMHLFIKYSFYFLINIWDTIKKTLGIKPPPKKYYLSALAIFKMESPWLKEWIEYHRLVGIEHFYMYNNDIDTTDSDIILSPYIDAWIVENIHFPGKVQQMRAYRAGLKKAKWETEWLAIIDLDEFIYPIKEKTVPDILKNFENYSGLVINWKIFGSSWLLKRPPNQINYFLHRAEIDFPQNRSIKSIVRPDYTNTILAYNPHFYFYHRGFAVDETWRQVRDTTCNDITMRDICIHHYGVRSYQDWVEVKNDIGRADVAHISRDMSEFTDRNRNDVFDDSLSQRFWKSLWLQWGSFPQELNN